MIAKHRFAARRPSISAGQNAGIRALILTTLSGALAMAGTLARTLA